MTPPPDAVRLGISQLQARLCVSRETIRNWVTEGKLPRPHYVAGLRRWWLHEVEAWEARNVTESSDRTNLPVLRPPATGG